MVQHGVESASDLRNLSSSRASERESCYLGD
jgi:hypothetical protein